MVGANDRIIQSLVPEWVNHQKRKAEDYNSKPMPGFPEGFENADVLGVQGQFAEIWRKIWKLKRGMWDGETLVGEPVREVLLDMIGHCFLAIDMIDRQTIKVLEFEENVPDRRKLQNMVGHGWDDCGVCRKNVVILEEALGRRVDWQSDIP